MQSPDTLPTYELKLGEPAYQKTPQPAHVHDAEKTELPADLRRKLNGFLPDGFGAAVLYPPGQPPRVVGVKLPRRSSGHAPRRPVQIPLDSFRAVQAQRPRRVTRRQLAKLKAAQSQAEKMTAQPVVDAVAAGVAKTCSRFAENLRARGRAIASFFGLTGVPVSNVEVCPA